MRVLRVEHPDDGVGPYYRLVRLPELNDHQPPSRPGMRDLLDRAGLDSWAATHIAGFQDEARLEWWFQGLKLALHREGFMIAEYEAEAVLGPDRAGQVAIEKQTATRLGYRPLI